MGNKGCYVIKGDSSIPPKTFVLQGYNQYLAIALGRILFRLVVYPELHRYSF